MGNERVVVLSDYRKERELKAKVESYMSYVKLLDTAELVHESTSYMKLIKDRGIQRDCAEKGLILFDELIGRLNRSNLGVNQQMKELHEELKRNVERVVNKLDAE